MNQFNKALTKLSYINHHIYVYDLVYTFFLRYKSFESTPLDIYQEHFGKYADTVLEVVRKTEKEGIESIHSLLQALRQQRKDIHLMLDSITSPDIPTEEKE